MFSSLSGWCARLWVVCAVATAACGPGESLPSAEPAQVAQRRSALATAAVYDATRRTPACASVGTGCDSGTLLNGRAGLGPERNAPNTLRATCADGAYGSYRYDESLERLEVNTQDGSALAPGKVVQIRATVWAYSGYSSDKLDLYAAANADAPSWTYLTTLTPPGSGSRVLSTTYTLPAGALQVVRGVFRYSGSPASCGSGSYTDNDDLVFAVGTGTVPDAPPTVRLTAPTAGATLRNVATLQAEASDADGISKVEFYVDGNLLYTDTTAPYSASWDTGLLANGAHALSARATDTKGNSATAPVLDVTVANDWVAPSVALMEPAAGAVLYGSVALRVSASDDVGVSSVAYYRNGTFLGSSTVGPDFRYDWYSASAANGSHTLTAVAQDAAGNSATSAGVTVTLDNDTTPPTATVLQPTRDAIVPSDVTLTASASDDRGLRWLDFKVDGVLVCQFALDGATSAQRSCTWRASAATRVLQVHARDLQGNETLSTSVPFTIDTAPPSAAIEQPQPGATVWDTLQVAVLAADDHGVARTELYVDEVLVGTRTTAPWGFSWDTLSVANGSHSLRVGVVDAAGNSGTSTRIGLTVANDFTPPEVVLLSPSEGQRSSGWVTLRARATDARGLSRLEFLVDGQSECSVPLSGVGSYEGTCSVYRTSGTHAAAVRAYDARNVSSASVSYSTDTTFPTVTVTQPAQYATVGGTVTVEVNAADDDQVARVEFQVPGAPVAVLTAPPYVFAWDSRTTPNGAANVTVSAFDRVGNRSDTVHAVTVNNDRTPPSVSLTSPYAWQIFTSAPTLSAYATDSVGVTGLELWLDGVLLTGISPGGTPSTTIDFLWDRPDASEGTHLLSARARDAAGNVSESASVNFVLDRYAPTVALLSPAPGAELSGTVRVEAAAADGYGIDHLALLVDGVEVLRSSGAYPYLDWDTRAIAPGPHVLTVRAQDLAGHVTDSEPVDVTVLATTPPRVSLFVPSETVSGQVDVFASVEGFGPVVRLELWADTQVVATFENPPASAMLRWDTLGTRDGVHQLRVAAFDVAGEVLFSDPTQVTVANDLQPPNAFLYVSSAGAEAGDVVQGELRVEGHAWDDTGFTRLELYLDGVLVASSSGEPSNLWFTWDTRATPDGAHTLELQAFDAYAKLTSVTRTLTVRNDQQSPMAELKVRDANGFEPSGPQVQGTLFVDGYGWDDGQVVSVELRLDGQLVASTQAEPYFVQYIWDTLGTPNGVHTLELRVADATGKVGTSTRSFTVDNPLPPPPLFISSPAEGGLVSGPAGVEVATWGLAVPPTRIDLLVDGQPVASAFDYYGNATLLWDSTAYADGEHTLVARAHGPDGLLGESLPVTVTVSNGDGLSRAVFDEALQAPGCAEPSFSCSSGYLIAGRGAEGGELHAPNTLATGACSDTAAGGFHEGASLDLLEVSVADGTPLSAGALVSVEARSWSTSSLDVLDLYAAADASAPTWVLVASVPMGGPGHRIVQTGYELTPGPAGLRALRGVMRTGGEPSACAEGADHDDLFFFAK